MRRNLGMCRARWQDRSGIPRIECDRTFLRWQQLPIESCAVADAYRQFAAQCVELARHLDGHRTAPSYWKWRYCGHAWRSTPQSIPSPKNPRTRVPNLTLGEERTSSAPTCLWLSDLRAKQGMLPLLAHEVRPYLVCGEAVSGIGRRAASCL